MTETSEQRTDLIAPGPFLEAKATLSLVDPIEPSPKKQKALLAGAERAFGNLIDGTKMKPYDSVKARRLVSGTLSAFSNMLAPDY